MQWPNGKKGAVPAVLLGTAAVMSVAIPLQHSILALMYSKGGVIDGRRNETHELRKLSQAFFTYKK